MVDGTAGWGSGTRGFWVAPHGGPVRVCPADRRPWLDCQGPRARVSDGSLSGHLPISRRAVPLDTGSEGAGDRDRRAIVHRGAFPRCPPLGGHGLRFNSSWFIWIFPGGPWIGPPGLGYFARANVCPALSTIVSSLPWLLPAVRSSPRYLPGSRAPGYHPSLASVVAATPRRTAASAARGGAPPRGRACMCPFLPPRDSRQRREEFHDAMRFIVKPLIEKPSKGPPHITMCALCSEDPLFCDWW